MAFTRRKGGSKMPESWLSLTATMAQFVPEYSISSLGIQVQCII
ncbi:hypothetical protein [Paenibacillus sp. Soil766]|nr:hypothetical protein [Paenibacillus sp. Soil766]